MLSGYIRVPATSNGSTLGTLLLGTSQNASNHMKMQTSNATAKFMRLITLLVCFKKIITLFYSNFLIFSPLIYFLWPSFSTLIYFCILVLPLYHQFPIKGGFILIDEGRNTTCMLARHQFDGSLQVEDDLSFFLDCFHWLLSHWIELANVHKHITRWGYFFKLLHTSFNG
jgi:hypothetical protein